MTIETWIIVNKETGEQWQASSGKSSWRKKNHAESSWHCHWRGLGYPNTTHIPETVMDYEWEAISAKFDNQDDYELKEISASLVSELEATIQKMTAMVKSEEWQQLKEFVCGKD